MYKWLYLDPYAEITFNHTSKQCLIFNVLDSKKHSFEGKDYELIKKIFNNSYSAKLSDNEIKEYQSLISKLEEEFIGGVYTSNDKPLILYPILNIQKNLRKFKTISYRNQGTDILENLLEISIHLSSTKQSVDSIINLLEQAENSSLKKINIYIGSCLTQKNKVDALTTFLKSFRVKTYIYINAKEYISFSQNHLDLINQEVFSTVAIVDNVNFNKAILNEKNIKLLFRIANSEDYGYYSSIIPEGLEYDFEIDFIKADTSFLEDNVYLNIEDILEIKLTKQSYDANKVLNRNLFGKIVIRDNSIYNSEKSNKPIASLIDEPNVKQIVFDSLCKSDNWFLIRRNVKPCKSCLYRNICPPISENEIVLKKYNLCNVTN